MGKYKVAIIGAGSIGALKDDEFDSVDGENIFTQAHAFYNHFKTELVGIVDRDQAKAEKAGSKWSCPAFVSIDDLAKNCQPDIVSICTPTETHLSVYREVCQKLNPSLIIIEKPCGSSYEECAEISNGEVPVLVDYSRRFNPYYTPFPDEIEFFSARLLYTRGFKHEACHALDLFNMWFGNCVAAYAYDQFGIPDRSPNDPSIFSVFKFEKCKHVTCVPVDGRKYSVFDIELVTNQGIVRFLEHGNLIQVDELEPSPYGNYLAVKTGVPENTDMSNNLYWMACNAVGFLDRKQELGCTVFDALKVHKIYHQLGL